MIGIISTASRKHHVLICQKGRVVGWKLVKLYPLTKLRAIYSLEELEYRDLILLGHGERITYAKTKEQLLLRLARRNNQ